MIGRLLDNNWSCVLLIGLCLRFVEGKMVHHHQQPYHSKSLVHGNDIRLITFTDGEYKPAAGEILAKDSILYSQKPETRLLRRQLWPIMQETMDTLVDSVSAGANLFKNMLATNPHPIATKIRNIKNAYMATTLPHKKFMKFPPMKKVKKSKNYPESHRTKTVSDDYVHTYHDEAYTVPTYVTKSKNPYSQMGLKDYKHFEETVLRELEEKEERKVEAALNSSHKKKPKDSEGELVQGNPFDGWRPVTPSNDFDQMKHQPKQVGKLHTSFVASNHRPVHEVVDESRTMEQLHESVIEPPKTTTNGATKTRKRKPNSSRTTVSTTTVSPTKQEQPNYPEYFLKKHKDVNKTIQNAQDVSQELNYLKRMKFYREHMQGLATSTTSRPPNTRDSLIIDASEERFVFITPLPKLSKERKSQRQKSKDSGEWKTLEKANIKNRGSIKFSDSV